MKLKIISILVLCLLLTGCINQTEEICSGIENIMFDGDNTTVWYDDKLCIIEEDNVTVTKVYTLRCSTLGINRFEGIIRTNETLDEESEGIITRCHLKLLRELEE